MYRHPQLFGKRRRAQVSCPDVRDARVPGFGQALFERLLHAEQSARQVQRHAEALFLEGRQLLRHSRIGEVDPFALLCRLRQAGVGKPRPQRQFSIREVYPVRRGREWFHGKRHRFMHRAQPFQLFQRLAAQPVQ